MFGPGARLKWEMALKLKELFSHLVGGLIKQRLSGMGMVPVQPFVISSLRVYTPPL